MVLVACVDSEVPVRTAAAQQFQTASTKSAVGVGKSTAGNYLAGRFAHKNHDFSTAGRFLSRALSADRRNRDLLRRTFIARLAEGDVDGAMKLARSLIKLDAKAPLANLSLATGFIKEGKYTAAEQRLKSMTKRGLNNFMVPLARAWSLAGQGKTTAAVKALAPLRKMTGFTVLYELHAGLISEMGGKTKSARAHYLKAVKGASRSTLRVVQILGVNYERSGEGKKAAALYAKYISENPDSMVLEPALKRIRKGQKPARVVASARDGMAEAFFNLAGTLTQENSILMALIYGRMALGLRPDFPLAQMLVGRILEMLGRQRDAITVYDSVAAGSPLRWSARLRQASSLEVLGKDDEAIRQLKAMAREGSARPDVLISLGDLLRSKKRFAQSVKAYDAAIKRIGTINKRHWTLLYSRGIALERSKQWRRAEKDFQRALKLNPDQPYVLNYLGYSWVDQGINLVRARTMIERAVELRPNDGYIVDSLGWALYRIGEFDDALRHLERAVELRPQDPTINDHLGDVYWRVGRRIEASFQWRRSLALKPEADQITIIRDKIENGMKNAKRSTKGG